MAEEHDGCFLDVYVLDPPSLIHKTLRALHIHTLEDLLALDLEDASQQRGVGQAKIDALHDLQARARELHTLAPDSEDLKKLATPDLLSELLAAQIDVDEPWDEVLRRLDVRTRNVLQRARLRSLRELVLRFESGSLQHVQGFGEATHERIQSHMNQLIELGLEGYLWGEGGKPEQLDEAVSRVLQSLQGQDHLLVVARFLQHKTLEKIGEHLGLSRERVRQRLEKILHTIRVQWLDAFKAMLGELVDVLEDRSGLISKSVCMALTDEAQHEHITFGLEVLGVPARWCATSHFLTTLQVNQIESLFQQLRAELEQHDAVVTHATHLEQLAHTRGWPAPAEEIVAFLENRWDVRLVGGEARLVEHPWTDWGRLCAQVLRTHGAPATIEEVSDLFSIMYGLSAAPSNRQLALALSRHPEVHHVERGRYLHRDSLSLDGAELDAIATWCIEHIQGVHHAVSTASLLDGLRASFWPDLPDDISPLLLRDIMGRDARVRLFQSTDMVAHLDSFEGKRQTQTEMLDELLAAQTLPLDCEAICALIPSHVSYHPNAIAAALREAPYMLNLGQGLFLHSEAIGLTPRALERLCEHAAAVLQDAGEPRSASRLLAALPTTPSTAYLKAYTHGAQVLFALLARQDEVVAGSGYMMAGRHEEHGEEQDPALQAIVTIVRRHETITASTLRVLIEEEFGWDASTSALYHAVSRALVLGLVERDASQEGLTLVHVCACMETM